MNIDFASDDKDLLEDAILVLFCEECLVRDDRAAVRLTEAYSVYSELAVSLMHTPMSFRAFKVAMRNMGLTMCPTGCTYRLLCVSLGGTIS